MKLFLAWLTAFTSSATLFAVLYAAMVTARVSSDEKLEIQVKQDFAASERPEFVLRKADYASFRPENAELLTAGIKTLKLLKAAKLKEAKVTIGNALAQTPESAGVSEAERLQKLIEEELALQVDVSREEDDQPEIKTTRGLLERRADLVREYYMLGHDTAESLGFEDEAIQFLSASAAVSVNNQLLAFQTALYQSGIFEGLPVIPELPDAVPNLLRLKQYIPSGKRGAVVKALEKASSDLAKKLKVLTEKTEVLEASMAENLNAYNELLSQQSVATGNTEQVLDSYPELEKAARATIQAAARSRKEPVEARIQQKSLELLEGIFGDSARSWFYSA